MSEPTYCPFCRLSMGHTPNCDVWTMLDDYPDRPIIITAS